MRTIVQNIAAGQRINAGAQGTMIKCLSCTPATTFRVDIDGEPADMQQGDKIRWPKLFKDFFITNPSGAPIAITFMVGEGDQDSAVFSGSVTVNGGTVDQTIPKRFAVDVDATINAGVTQVIASDSTREEVMIQAAETNPGNLRVGFNGSISDTCGFILRPGEMITLRTTSSVGVRNPTGGTPCVYQWGYIAK